MNLPKQVQDQATELEAMLDKIKAENTTPDVALSDEAPTPQPDEAATPQPDVETPAEIDWEERARKADARYQVLQGKYNKEIGEVHRDDANLKAEIASLKQQLAHVESQKAEVPKNSSLDELREDYGSDLVDGLYQSIYQQIMGEVSTQVGNVQRSVSQESAATKQQLLAQQLQGHNINFSQMDSDPLFHEWLSKFDPESGIQRQEQLVNHFGRGDLAATAQMYIEFAHGGSQPQQTQPQSNPFESHVQHQTTAPATQDAAPTSAAFTRAQVAQFYTDWAKGKYTNEEAKRIEKEIINSNTR